jgi:hypothetical protein
MLTFFLEEGVLTLGTISGLFTANMLNSLKLNIMDPLFEKIFDSEYLDMHAKKNTAEENARCKHVKWQTFTRDFVTWLIVILILYLSWKYYIKPHKLNNLNLISK